ncbi:MAG: hypothetical protein HY661_09705 [Betaproteobacteria bacterium]|nr:hypothetical protein [Betaproteobacteria bacterium]
MVGLVVIVAFCLYTAFAVFVAKRVGRLAKSRVGQNALIAAVLAVLYLAPVADGIYGYFVLQHLCATEAKTEVLKPIKIPPEYFKPNGSPKFLTGEFRNVDWRYLKGLLQIRYDETKNYGVKNLTRITSTLASAGADEVFARRVSFYFQGGWLRYNGDGIGADRCIPRPSFDQLVPHTVMSP